MKPYYTDGKGITIYHGDCREILPTQSKVDLVLTDPPYGIADVWKGGFSSKHGWGRAEKQKDLRNLWDQEPPDKETLTLVRSAGSDVVIWGGNYFDLPISRGWLVWTKPERNFTLSEAELAWTSRDSIIRVWSGNRSDVGREHPTQKTLGVMAWTLSLFPAAQTIIDPFMGSGTTLVAAKQLGRCAVGIEIEERYCEIAAKRVSHTPRPLLIALSANKRAAKRRLL